MHEWTQRKDNQEHKQKDIWAPSSYFVSSSIPSWQILTAHVQPVRGARDLAFCLKVPLDSLLVWASSEGSGETARMRRLGWTFAARIGNKYQIRLTRSNSNKCHRQGSHLSAGIIISGPYRRVEIVTPQDVHTHVDGQKRNQPPLPVACCSKYTHYCSVWTVVL